MATTETEERVTVATWVPLSVAHELRNRAARADRSRQRRVRRALARHLKAIPNDEPTRVERFAVE